MVIIIITGNRIITNGNSNIAVIVIFETELKVVVAVLLSSFFLKNNRHMHPKILKGLSLGLSFQFF